MLVLCVSKHFSPWPRSADPWSRPFFSITCLRRSRFSVCQVEFMTHSGHVCGNVEWRFDLLTRTQNRNMTSHQGQRQRANNRHRWFHEGGGCLFQAAVTEISSLRAAAKRAFGKQRSDWSAFSQRRLAAGSCAAWEKAMLMLMGCHAAHFRYKLARHGGQRPRDAFLSFNFSRPSSVFLADG